MDTHFHKPAEPWEKTEGWVQHAAAADEGVVSTLCMHAYIVAQ